MKTQKKSHRGLIFLLLVLTGLLLTAYGVTIKRIDRLIPLPQPSFNGIVVCVDAGHGGKDPGCNTPERRESDDNLAFAKALKQELEQEGCQVIMTREDDTYLTLEERCAIANDRNADYFLCIHRNIVEGDACGVEVWRSHAAGDETVYLADSVMSGLETVGVQRNRGVQVGSRDNGSSDFYVLQYTKMPCALVEMGFLNDAEDNDLFDRKLNDYARSIAQAIVSTYEAFHE